MRRLLKYIALVWIVWSAAGCVTTADKLPAATTKVKAADVRLADGKQRLLVVTAKRDQAIFFTRPPYQLHGAWRVEASAGIYDPAKVADVGMAIFGVEVDLLPSGRTPTQFYGVFARRFETPVAGLQVFAGTHTAAAGQIFLPGATVADLVVESDGATVTLLARDAAAGGAYQTVDTIPLGTPGSPHYPGFGVFGAPAGAPVGFPNFRIPVNGDPATPPSAEYDALNDVYRAAFDVLDAVYALDGPGITVEDLTAADEALTRAEIRLFAAGMKVEALIPKAGTPAEKALAAIRKADKALMKAHGGLDKKGAKGAKPFLKSVTTKMFAAAFACTDALLPDDVRATLPGRGLDW